MSPAVDFQCDAGRKTGTTMSTRSRLDLPQDASLDTWPPHVWTIRCQFRMRSALRLLRATRGLGLDGLEQDLDVRRRCHAAGLIHSFLREDALALEADVDDDSCR